MPLRRPLDKERLLSNCQIDPITECWLWTGALNRDGYGSLMHDGRSESAHRAAYKVLVGPTKPKLQVLHHCDVRNCMNPKHLYLGTHTDNMRDREVRGRVKHEKGEDHRWAKLSEADVRAIRRDSRVHKVIAAEYGVVPSLVSMIRARKNWKHIE